MASNVTCDTVINKFIALSGQISPTLWAKKMVSSGPWMSSTPRMDWPDGMGTIISNIIWERIVSDESGDKWSDVNVSDGSTIDNCLPAPEILNWGQTTRTMRLQKRDIQTPEFCVEDLRFDFQIEQYLNSLLDGVAGVTQYVWENRDRTEYIRLADHKVTETGNVFNINATSFDAANPPTSRLVNGTLERIYQRLLMDGVSMRGSVGKNGFDRPVIDLFTDDTTGRDLIRQDPELRDDFRFAFMGEKDKSPLIQMMGTSYSYNGYRIVYDPYPARYDIVNGAYVRRYPFGGTGDPTTMGVKHEVDPVYMYAAYQDHVIHIPQVFTQRVPKPIGSLGRFKFDPVKYTGDFVFRNILDKICNPRGTKIFLDAAFRSASEPGLTHLGWVVRALNCPPIRNAEPSCYS